MTLTIRSHQGVRANFGVTSYKFYWGLGSQRTDTQTCSLATPAVHSLDQRPWWYRKLSPKRLTPPPPPPMFTWHRNCLLTKILATYRHYKDHYETGQRFPSRRQHSLVWRRRKDVQRQRCVLLTRLTDIIIPEISYKLNMRNIRMLGCLDGLRKTNSLSLESRAFTWLVSVDSNTHFNMPAISVNNSWKSLLEGPFGPNVTWLQVIRVQTISTRLRLSISGIWRCRNENYGASKLAVCGVAPALRWADPSPTEIETTKRLIKSLLTPNK